MTHVLGAPRTIHGLLRGASHSRIEVAGQVRTSAELYERAERLAHRLIDMGLQPGDRVAVILPNRIEMIESLFAVGLAGGIIVPLNPFLKGDFLAHQLRDAAPRILIADSEGIESVSRTHERFETLIAVDGVESTSGMDLRGIGSVVGFVADREQGSDRHLPEVDPLSPIAVMYTSGTTGRSKGCVLSHRYYVHVGETFEGQLGFQSTDVLLTAFPLFHASGQIANLMGALAADASLIVTDQFHASTYMAEAGLRGATLTWGVGAMGEAILRQPSAETDRTHGLRYCNFTPMQVDRLAEFRARFGVEVSGQMYAQTECMPVSLSPIGDPGRPGSSGKPNPNLQVAIVDTNDNSVPVGALGEIVVRPLHAGLMHDGYWARPEATAESLRSAWHHTGDLGKFDEEGYLHFVDRKKDAIRRRGENVSSAEVEAALLQHPAIREVAVHGVPADMSEEDIKAVIIVDDGLTIDPEELHSFCVASFPYFSIPRYVEYVEEMPKTPTGRVQKHILRELGIDNALDFHALGLVVERHQRRTSV